MTEQLDVLGSAEPVRRTPRQRSRAQVLVTGVAALTVLLTGVSYAGYQAIAPHGHDPEDALPAGTVAFAKVDLDPSASQKLAVYRLSKRFPKAHVKSDASVRDDLLTELFRSAGEDVDYRKDVKPWMGDRAAIGAVPGAAGEDPHPLMALQFHDKAAATKGVKHLQDIDSSQQTFYAFSDVDDYLIVSDSQAAADAAAHAKRHLSDDSRFSQAVATLRGGQIVTAWADLGKVLDLLPKDALKGNPFFPVDGLKASGQYVLGAHAENDAIEVELHRLGGTTGKAGTGTGSDLVQGFPSDAVAAMSITGLGDAVADAYDTVRPMLTDLGGGEVMSSLTKAGIRLPGDLRTVLGTEVGGYVAGTKDDPIAVLHVKTDNAAGAKAVLQKAVGLVGEWSGDPAPAGFLDSVFRSVPGGYVVGVPEEALTAKASSTLGGSTVFRKAVPDAHGAPAVVFVDIAGLQSTFDLSDNPELAKLEAFGMTVRADGDDSVTRVRLTFR